MCKYVFFSKWYWQSLDCHVRFKTPPPVCLRDNFKHFSCCPFLFAPDLYFHYWKQTLKFRCLRPKIPPKTPTWAQCVWWEMTLFPRRSSGGMSSWNAAQRRCRWRSWLTSWQPATWSKITSVPNPFTLCPIVKFIWHCWFWATLNKY